MMSFVVKDKLPLRIINNYQFIKPLGEGGFATVFLAKKENT